MSVAKIDGRLLKSVSRTFYLSIRLLPKRVRGPVGLAYLLARASDTIADCENVPAPTRLRRLADFEGQLRGQPSPHAVPSIQRDIQPPHRGERALIAALPSVIETFTAREMWEWKETSDLLANIIRGQGNDLDVFNDPSRVLALPDAAALDDYIYLVAGCVGEWWTRVCFHHLRHYSHVPEDELSPLANSFGKALQLVNILRDMPADLAAGRCYLPQDELQQIGIAPGDLQGAPMLAQPVFDQWVIRARELLEQGRQYIRAVRTRRVRMACFIPWRLAGQTLELIEKNPPLSATERIKVPRSAVRGAFWQSLRVAFSNKPLE